MVRALGRGGIRDADPLGRARVVSRQGLAFHDGHALDAEGLSGDLGAAADDAAQRGPLLHFLEKLDGGGRVAESGHTGLHSHGDGGSHLNGVQPDVVVHAVHAGDGVQVVNAAVGAVCPDRLVLGPFREILVVLVHVDARTADDAPRVAGVARNAAAGDDGRAFGLAADLLDAGELARGEVVGRVCSDGIDDVGEDVRAVGRKPFARDRVLGQELGEPPHVVFEGGVVLRRDPLGVGGINDNGLESFGPHYSAHAAASGVPRGASFGVRDGDAGGREPHLARRTDGDDGGVFAVFAAKGRGRLVVALETQVVGRGEPGAAGVNLENVRVGLGPAPDGARDGARGLALDDDGGDAQARKGGCGGASGVRFLDAAGQRAFGADRKPSRTGGGGAAQDSRRKHKTVLARERMTQRGHFGVDDGRGQRASAEADKLRSQRLFGNRQRLHVYAQHSGHHSASSKAGPPPG